MNSRLLALAALSAVALVPAATVPAAKGAVAPETTAPTPVSNIRVTITDKGIKLRPKFAQRGTVARFLLVNVGKKPHTFALGHSRRGTGTQTGFTKALKPSQQAVLIFFLDFRGTLPYRATLPADRSKPGMKGNFRII